MRGTAVTQRTEGATIRLRRHADRGRHIDCGAVACRRRARTCLSLSRGQVAVRGTINGVEFGTVLEPDGNSGHWMRVDDTTLQHAAGISAGEDATLDIEVTKDWPEPNIDELLAMGSSWPEAATMLPIRLVTSPQFYAHWKDFSFRHAPGIWLYRKAKPWAYGIKVFLQMIVGVGAVIDIAWHVERSVISTHKGGAPFAPNIMTSVAVIAPALAVAAAIELAYTLFTPGPDEALEPLMLGLSSGILFLITQNVDKNLSADARSFLLYCWECSPWVRYSSFEAASFATITSRTFA